MHLLYFERYHLSIAFIKNENIMTSNSMLNQVFLRPALATDILELETLLNRCYRFDEGWTNEKALIGGVRTNVNELKSVIDDTQQHLFIYPQTDNGQRDGQEAGEILGCINVAIEDNSAYIGFFAVNPELQGSGVGSAMLEEAENFAQRYFSNSKITPEQEFSEQASNDKSIKMLVLNGRPKMLAYYQRRGYVCTGNTQAFLEDNNEIKDLYFIEIVKIID